MKRGVASGRGRKGVGAKGKNLQNFKINAMLQKYILLKIYIFG